MDSSSDCEQQIARRGLQKTESSHLQWDKTNEEYPRNWSTARKTYDVAVIVFLEFYTLSDFQEFILALCRLLIVHRTAISTTGVGL